MKEPHWIKTARKYHGEKEIPGSRDNPVIVALWTLGKAGDFDDDETPWCAAYVSATLEESGVRSARTGWARAYLKWGKRLSGPAPGCIVVFSRGKVFGHVGYVIGRDKRNRLLVLGGNQGNKVSFDWFPKSRVLGYRWPNDEPMPEDTGFDTLPVMG